MQAWGYQAFFFVDVVLDTPWEETYLPLVEETINELLAQELPFEVVEMSTASAAGLFSHHKQELLKAQLPPQKNVLLQLIKRGDWAVPLDAGSFIQEGHYFSLKEGFVVGECSSGTIIRVAGLFSEEKKSVKKAPHPSEKEPTFLVEELQLLSFNDDGCSYPPRGEFVRQQLEKLCCEGLAKEKFKYVSTPKGRSWDESCRQLMLLKEDAVAQIGYLTHPEPLFEYGVLTPAEGFEDLFYQATPEQKLLETVISSLQMMRRIPRIFSFETQVVLRVPQSSSDLSLLRKALEGEPYDLEVGMAKHTGIEIRLVDSMGRAWSGPKLEILKEKPKPGWRAVVGSMVGSWERFLALLVQRNGGLPLMFIEEQVRIFAMKPDSQEYALEVQKSLEQAGLRSSIDVSTTQLSERIHQALKEKVPYLIVVGSKELASQRITWRTCDSGEETTTTVGEFVNMVKH